MTPTFFATLADFRRWLEVHHDQAQELWVGFYKKATGKPSITWPESVDQALCFGWIDGRRKSVDSENYMIRFTPRRPTSNWSLVNLQRVAELSDQGLMHPAGLAIFAARREAKDGVYAHEQRQAAELNPAEVAQFQAVPAAWAFFQAKPPSYREPAIWWVVSAKQPETRQKRLQTLIADSAAGRNIKPLTRPGKSSSVERSFPMV